MSYRTSRPQVKNYQYDSLEPRCVLTGPHQVFVPLPEGLNQVVNESFNSSVSSASGLYSPATVTGWNLVQTPSTTSPRFRLLNFPGQGQLLNLDASTSVDEVYQNVPTQQGTKYILSFDFRAHPFVFQQSVNIASTRFDVRWNGVVVATVQPGYFWKTIAIEVMGEEGTSELRFSETGTDNHSDLVGGLINRVRVVKTFQGYVANSGFEKTLGSPQGYYFGPHDVPGWNVTISKPIPRIKLEPAWPHNNSQFGNQILNLNANPGFRDEIFQNLDTDDDGLYYVQFMAKGNGTDQLNVKWNHRTVMFVHPGSRWESIGMLIKSPSDMKFDALTNLAFVEASANTGDLYIDNVRIFRIDQSRDGARPFQPQQGVSASYTAYWNPPSVEELTPKRRVRI